MSKPPFAELRVFDRGFDLQPFVGQDRCDPALGVRCHRHLTYWERGQGGGTIKTGFCLIMEDRWLPKRNKAARGRF
jgi:hypothetical protein